MTHPSLQHLFAIGTFAVAFALVLAIAGEVSLHRSDYSPALQGPTGLAIGVGEAPSGFTGPHDVFAGNAQVVSVDTVDLGNGMFRADIDVDQSDAVIYNKGYYVHDGVWTEFSFPDAPVQAGSPWIFASASTSLTLDYDDYVLYANDEEMLVAVYTCKLVNDQWRCGCANTACATSFWMLQSDDLGAPFSSGDYLSVTPYEQQVLVGHDVVLDVVIGGGEAVYGYDFDVEYDPSVLTFNSVTPGPYFGTNGYPGNTTPDVEFLCVDEQVSSGLVSHIACTRTGTDLSPGFGDVLQTLHFTAAAPGYSSVSISGAEIASWPTVATDDEVVISSWDATNAAAVIVFGSSEPIGIGPGSGGSTN